MTISVFGKIDIGLLNKKQVNIKLIICNFDFFLIKIIYLLTYTVIFLTFEVLLNISSEIFKSNLFHFKNYPHKNLRILEIGCGRGTASIYLSKKLNCKVTGIDFSENSIEIASVKFILYIIGT